MGRTLRAAAGGMIYHVLNRANARRPFFDQAQDFAAFEQVLSETQRKHPVTLHLVLAPRMDGELSRFAA
jgi:putative transposase